MEPDIVLLTGPVVEQYQKNLKLLKTQYGMIGSPNDTNQLRSDITAQMSVLQDFDNRLKEIFRVNNDPSDARLKKLGKDYRAVKDEARQVIQSITKNFSESKSNEDLILAKIRPMDNDGSSTESSLAVSSRGNQMVQQYDYTSQIEEQILKERHEAMVKIHTDMSDVNEMFVDLGKIVHQHQEAVNAIEKHAEDGHERALEGFGQIQKAKENQSLCVIS